jgi:two-component system, cell cycle sensor histidine kinase and response regulator CckA
MPEKPIHEVFEQRVLELEQIDLKRKQAEYALRESESLVSSIFRAAPTGIGVVSNRILLAVNDRVCDMIGYSREEIIGQSARMLYPSDAHFENVGTEKYRQILQYGTGTVETQWRCKDGRILDILMSSAPINPMDLAAGVTFTALDITDRKKAEDALRESERKHRLIAENTADLISILDMNLHFNYISPASMRLRGFTVEEAMDQTIEQVLTPESMRIALSVIEEEMLLEASGKADPDRSRILELEEYKKDGSIIWVEVSLSFLRDKELKPVEILAVSRDITDRKRAEDALRESEERLRILFNGINEAIFVHEGSEDGMPGLFIEVNDPACERLGYSRKEFLTMRPSDIDAPETVPNVPQMMDRLYAKGEAVWEGIHVRKDGSRIPVEIGNRLVCLEGRQVIISTVRDITERKKTEQALRDAALFARETQSIARVGGWKANPQTDYLEWTEGVYEIIEEATSFHPKLTEGMKYFLPHNISLIRDKITSCLTTGESFTMETEIITAKGRHLWTELRGIAPVVDCERAAVIGTLQDITNRKQAEEGLQESEALQRILLDNLPAGVIIVDPVTRVIERVNEHVAALFGAPVDHLLGHRCHSLLCPADDGACPVCDLGNTVDNSEREILRKDGSRLPILKTVKRIQLNGQEKLLECFVDLSERKRADEERQSLQSQLLQAQKMESVGRLAGGVAHDFNNMLQSITGNAELVLDKIDLAHPLYRNLSEILKVARRSADLTRQLLAFARKQTISPIALDLNETISSMLKMLHRLIGENIEFSWKPALNLWTVRVDPSQIDQILVNLCVNARDAIVGVGSVTITTENVQLDQSYNENHAGFIPGEYVQIAVSDTGSGMEKNMLDQIFEPFFTTKVTGKGTGLGLSTVYGIVKQNNGFVYVNSELGHGTTFKIYLPRFLGETMKLSGEGTSEFPIGSGETVLLVEDESIILDVGKEILEKLGYAVLAAKTPGEALRHIKAHVAAINLLITDVVMPEMNGRDLAQLIIDIKPGIKCLFISGYTANVIAHHGVLDPDINFIQKPFTIKQLAVKVREVLDETKGSTSDYKPSQNNRSKIIEKPS